MTIKTLIVDDHRMMREGLRAIFEQEPTIVVVGQAENGRAALDQVGELRPDVVVMDVGMPEMNGMEATRQIHAQHPGVRVIALSTHSDKRYVLGMLDAGASGYVLKVGAFDELQQAIHAVVGGQTYLSPAIAGTVVESLGQKGPKTSASRDLGAREREVLQLLSEGNTSAQIAARLHISVRTVEAHRRNIMRKLDRHSVAELTKYAVREGLTSLDD